MRASYWLILLINLLAANGEQPAETVSKFLSLWGTGNVSEAMLLTGESVVLSWHGSRKLFPTLGGDWVGKDSVMGFHNNFFLVFDAGKYQIRDITVLFSEGGMVLVQYEERTAALSSGKSGYLTNTATFTVVANQIIDIQVYLDTSFVYNQVHCPDLPYLYCGRNSPPPYDPSFHRDPRPPRLLPTALNCNVSSNQHIADTYFHQIAAGNFTSAFTLLAHNATITWRGDTFVFPTIGGTWLGKSDIQGFYNAMANIFNRSAFNSEKLLLVASSNIVMLRARDHNVAVTTGRTSVEVSITIFTFNDNSLIQDIEVWSDSAGILEAALCATPQRELDCKAYFTPPTEIALAFFNRLGSGDITGAATYLTDSVSLSYHAPPSLLGGVYLPRKEVIKFLNDFEKMFEREQFFDLEIVANTTDNAVVRFMENRTAVGTRLSYSLPMIVELKAYKEQIIYLHMFLDTAVVLATKECLLDKTAIHCDGNKPIGEPRVSDMRAAKPAPSVRNSNATQNEFTATSFLHHLASGNIERSLALVAENACLTFQASLTYFPTLGGTWSGKPQIRKFYANRASMFASPAFVFETMTISAASQNVLVVDYYENISSTRTRREFRDVSVVTFVFDDAGLIADVEFWANTAGMLDAMLCQGSPSVVCSAFPTPAPEAEGRVWVAWIFGTFAVISIVVAAVTFYQYRRKKQKVSAMEFNEKFLSAANSGVN